VLLDELIGAVVTEITLYGGIQLRFDEPSGAVLQIESDFVIRTDADEARVHFQPAYGEQPSGLNQLAALFRSTISSAVADEAGTLTLSFSNAAELQVEADMRFEAWMLSGTSRGTLVSLPGGGLG
jgi:hypothetical protein